MSLEDNYVSSSIFFFTDFCGKRNFPDEVGNGFDELIQNWKTYYILVVVTSLFDYICNSKNI